MRINSPYITGSATITGNLCVQGTILGTITGVASTASYAETLDGLDSTQFVQTGSFNSYTSSASSSIGSLSGSVATTTSGLSSSIGSLSSSVATNTSGLGGRITTIEGNYATTGSNTFIGNQVITGSICSNGNIVTTGQIVAQTINVQQVTSSIVYSCGSNIFGTSISNTQQFTGSILATGSLTMNGPLSGTTAYFAGNVGVNTSTPTNGKLEVQQNSCVPGLWVQTGGVTSAFCIASFRTGTNLPALEIYGNGNLYFGGTSCFQSGVCINHTGKPQLSINGNTGAGAALSFQTQLANSTCNRNWAFVTEDNAAGDFALKVSCQQYCNPISFGTTVMQFNRCGWMTIGSTVEEALLTVDSLNKNISSIRVKADCGAQAISIGGTGEFKVDAPGLGGGRFIIRDNCFVGIGAVSPADLLHMCSVGEANLRMQSTTSGKTYRLVTTTGGSFIIDDFGVANRMIIGSSGTFGFNCTGIAARTMVVKGVTGCYIVAEFVEPAGVHSIEIYPNKSSTNHISSDYMSGGSYLPLSLSGRENVNDLVLTTDGRSYFQCQLMVGAAGVAQQHVLDVQLAAGACVISGTPGTACTQNMSGIRVYNTASGTSNSMTGIWFHTGPHLAGIASGRCEASAGWGNDLRFYVHYQTTDTLNNSYEKMRLNPEGVLTLFGYGSGTLTTNGSGVISASDGRLKTKTRTIENGLCSVMQLQPTYYRWNECTTFYTEYEELGFIAQEVACVIPAASPEPEEVHKFKNYSDRAIIAMLTKGMQEQQCMINTLKSCLGIN